MHFKSLHISLNIILEISKRSFFPGKSLYFWFLIGLGFYLYYLYAINKNKNDFFKSGYIQTFAISLALFFIAFLSINLFISDPLPEKTKEKDPLANILKLVHNDKSLLEKAEKEFTNPEIHYEYIKNHFEIPKEWGDAYLQPSYRDDYTIVNFYYDKLSVQDTVYTDNAKLALGMFYFYKDSIETSLSYFNSIFDKNFPIAESYKAKIYLAREDINNAIIHYSNASKIKDLFQEESKTKLIHLLEDQGNDKELYTLLKSDSYKNYFSVKLASRLYFLNHNYIDYYKILIKHCIKGVKLTGAIAALIIMLIWGLYLLGLDIFEKENKFILLMTLLAGMIFPFLCFFLYDFFDFILNFSKQKSSLFLYSIFGIGVIEEFVKIIPLLIILAISRNIINEPYDYILYASISALGFSFVENLLYFDGELSGIIHGRGLTSVPGHIIDSSIVAYGLVLAKYRYSDLPSWAGFILFFLLGAINHGLYDYWLFTGLYFFFIVGFLLSISLWIIIINNCLNNSPSFNYLISSRSNKLQLTLGLSLISILILEYIIVAWEKGPMLANASFNSSLIVAGLIILYYSNRLTNIDLVKGYWAGIPYKTIDEKRSGKIFDVRYFLVRLFSGDTFSHSFLHLVVSIQAHPDNEKLITYFNSSVKGKINDRLVVGCKNKVGDKYEDPFWFRIDCNHSINVGSMESSLLFRFEDVHPSFDNNDTLIIYLFAIKNKDSLQTDFERDDLRALGKAVIRKQ